MSKISQKEAVYNAILNVIGTIDGVVSLSREQRSQVNMILIEGFKAGKIELNTEYNDEELKSYVSGLQANWLRKDKRLNGEVDYVIKNPGSRRYAVDPQLKALKALMSTMTTDEEKSEVQGYIDAREAELKQAAIKKVEIDVDFLPEALRSKFTK